MYNPQLFVTSKKKILSNNFPTHLYTKYISRVVKHLNELPREVVEAPSLATFKARLDGALSNLI